MSENKILLSILIPTVVDREEQYSRLSAKLYKQISDIENREISAIMKESGKSTCTYSPKVDIQRYLDNKEKTIGEKRDLLYEIAKGKYSWQIDDDDDIADNAIELILNAIQSNPEVDCITFEEYVNVDGREYKSNHSLTYSSWYGDGSRLLHDGFHYHRSPFFKDVIKTSIAQSVPVPHIRYAEDVEWSEELHKHLATEIHISQPLYRYIHISSDHNTRYGITENQ